MSQTKVIAPDGREFVGREVERRIDFLAGGTTTSVTIELEDGSQVAISAAGVQVTRSAQPGTSKQHLGPAPFSPAAVRAGGRAMRTNVKPVGTPHSHFTRGPGQ